MQQVLIGSNLVWALNLRGHSDIVLVDRLDKTDKFRNLNHLFFRDIITPEAFLANPGSYSDADVVFHQGAISATTEYDGARVMQHNYEYSRELYNWCKRDGRRFIYASTAATYGDGNHGFTPGRESEAPLNVYGFSKLVFDRFLEQQSFNAQVAGLRYFNVYGPGEGHKERMASVPWHLMRQAENEKKMHLFEGSEEFYRDFVYIDDVIKVNLFLLDHPEISGLFNVGTGQARSFYDLGSILNGLMPEALLELIPFPDDLKGRYQKYTCADLSSLYAGGYENSWTALEDGLKDYHHHFVNYGGYRPAPVVSNMGI